MHLFCRPKFRKPHSFLSISCMCEVDHSGRASLPALGPLSYCYVTK